MIRKKSDMAEIVRDLGVDVGAFDELLFVDAETLDRQFRRLHERFDALETRLSQVEADTARLKVMAHRTLVGIGVIVVAVVAPWLFKALG